MQAKARRGTGHQLLPSRGLEDAALQFPATGLERRALLARLPELPHRGVRDRLAQVDADGDAERDDEPEHHPVTALQRHGALRKMRSSALRARGLAATSAASGRIG